MIGKLFSDVPRRNGFKVVHQLGQLYLRRRFEQDMDMVTFAVHFDNFRTPLVKQIMSDLL
jgi:hypothetical protein